MGMSRLARMVGLVTAAGALLTATTLVVAQSAGAAAPTVVSLTFDDGQSSQYATLPMLQSRGMQGTYYINSGWVGDSDYYMEWSQVHELAAAGNEIGGHTLTHQNLTQVSLATAQREVCDDRQALLAQGFSPVTSFAYPEAEYNTQAKQVAQGCGYTSARAVGGVSEDGCDDCPSAETVPPGDPYALLTPQAADTSTTVEQLQHYVTEAEEHGGGWVVLTFHGICDDNCADDLSLDPAVFTAFLDWLQPRQATGTVVRTVGSVMGPPEPGPPVTTVRCNGSACGSGWYGAGTVDVSLVASDPDGSAVASTRYTTDGTDPATSDTAQTYAEPFPVDATTTVRFASTDVDGHAETAKSQLIRFDTTAPEVSLTNPVAGSSYRTGARVTLTAAASDTGSGVARVVFRDGSTTLGTDSTAPYQYSWRIRSSTAAGEHNLTAVATDAAGNPTTSTTVPVTITR